MIALSLSTLPMHPFHLPLVLTPHPQPCPCHSEPHNSARDPCPPSDAIQLLALTTSLFFLSKPPNPSCVGIYLTSSILPSLHPPYPVPGSAAQSSLSTCKGGSWACLFNYRPISILPASSKLLERHVKEKVTEHLDCNNLLYSYQFGFRALVTQLSPCTALIMVPSTWPKAVRRCSLSWCFEGLWHREPSTIAFQTSLPWCWCSSLTSLIVPKSLVHPILHLLLALQPLVSCRALFLILPFSRSS